MMIRKIKKYSKEGEYLEFTPTKSTPLGTIVFLHGLGEVGTNITMIEKLPIPSLFKTDFEVPYIIICPQLRSGTMWYKNTLLDIHKIVKSYGMSENHITGLSLGAMGTISMLQHIAVELDDVGFYKTAGICCGKGSNSDMKPHLKTKVRWWHGINDKTLPISNARAFIKKLVAEGGDGDLIELYDDHNIWNDVYNPNNSLGYWTWLESTRPVVPQIPETPAEVKVPVTSLEIVNDQYLVINGTHKIEISKL